MVYIELRKDGWFEAGKDSEKTFPLAYLIYGSKQELKKKLEEIGEKESVSELEKELSKIPEVSHFKRGPYLRGNHIMIDTHGLPGECYLGCVKE